MTQEISIPNAEFVPIDQLKVDGQNPNRMTEEQHERLAICIKKYGFIVPIITNKDLLIADGEQRWIVAKSLGMTQVSIIRLPVVDVDRRLLRQVLNKLHGEHDLLGDAKEFEAIIEAGRKEDLQLLLSLSEGSIERYLLELHPPRDEDFEIPEIDKVQTAIKKGDIFCLGNHRLMCGDSTSPDDIKILLSGGSVEVVVTDPPYGVAFDKHHMKDESFRLKPSSKKVSSGFRNWGEIQGDKTLETYLKFIEAIAPILKEKSWYLCTSSKAISAIFSKLEELDIYYATPIIWVKENFVMSWERYKAQHENIIFCGDGAHPTGAKSIWYGKNNETTVWQINRPVTKELKHPTQKPVALIIRAITNSSQPKDGVADFFCGSGTTLIACEQTNRVCYAMEIDPRYCEIICQRWEAYTRQKRKLVKSGKNDVKQNGNPADC